MPGVTLLFAVITFVLVVGGGVALYGLVRSEHGQRTTTDRETAEAMARRDTDGDDGASDGDVQGNHWE